MYELTRMLEEGLREQSARQKYGGRPRSPADRNRGGIRRSLALATGRSGVAGVDPAIRGMRSGFRGVPVAVGSNSTHGGQGQ